MERMNTTPTNLLSPDQTTFPSHNHRPISPTTAYERPYDPPTPHHHDDADIAMQQQFDNGPHPAQQTPSPIFSPYTDYSHQPNSATWNDDTNFLLPSTSTAKKYDYHESRRMLFKTGAYRFLVTLAFSVLIGLTLKAYEGFAKPFIMDKTQERVFNSLMLGLSLGLGLNLASSLKRYAVIFRWYLLTRRYVSLEVFDLILGLETLTNVAKLMVISLPGIGPKGRLRFLRGLPWFREGRGDGTRLTWVACLLWLFINVGAQILVAALSLFWPADPSNVSLTAWGSVTVANLTSWTSNVDTSGAWNNDTAMSTAWVHGMEAVTYDTIDVDDQRDVFRPLYKGDGFYEYRFYNRDPENQHKNYAVSSRSVKAQATCRELETEGSIKSVKKNNSTMLYIKARDEGKDWLYYYLTTNVPGAIVWASSTFELCGPRCTNLTVVQVEDDSAIKKTSMFFCNSTVSDIESTSSEFVNLSSEDREALKGTDNFARIAAGSIAWTGVLMNGWKDRESRDYLGGSELSPNEMVTKEKVEDILSRFTIGSIASFDDHGVRYNLTNQPARPVPGQQLDVHWSWVLGLLGGILIIQLAALALLLAWGNRSIMRDESAFSLAMLLSPVVNRVGKEGMNLSGEELKQHPKLKWRRIKYDYVAGKDGEPNRVEVVFHGRGDQDSRRSWQPGMYV